MHILFLTDNFPPEGNAPASRTYEHAIEWVRMGHKVTVITGAPNFPEGKIYDGYKNSWYSKETMDGIDVRRVKTYIAPNKGFAKRILDYLSFMVTSTIAGLFAKRPDVVVATSPQFFCAMGGFILAFVRRLPFVFELRDIWPASITAVGAMRDSMVIRILERIEMFLYQRASMIVAVTESFKRELIERGVAPNKISVIRNGVDLGSFAPLERDKEFADRYQLSDKFVVGYVGTHGMAHALETVIDAAEALRSYDHIRFLFAGGGAGVDLVAQLVKEKRLDNVVVLGRQDKLLMPRVWSLCDVSLVHLKDAAVFASVIPSKMFESMAMGLPIIIGIPKGEATDIVESTGSGIVVRPQNVHDIVAAILKLIDDQVYRQQLAKAGLDAAPQFERRRLARQMLADIEGLIERGR